MARVSSTDHSVQPPIVSIPPDGYNAAHDLIELNRHYHAPHVTLLKRQNCRHSPHRDQEAAVLAAVAKWLGRADRRVNEDFP